MQSFTFVIRDPVGLHARPAGQLAKLAKSSGSTVTITKGDRSVNCSQLMKIMGLGVKQGDTVTVQISGGNEAASLNTIRNFFEGNL